MKKSVILLICIFIFSRTSISQCSINTISTNPSNYQNASDPSQLLKWDWRLQTWNGYRPGTPAPVLYQITSPFYNTNGNPNIVDLSLVTNKNYRPEDGWEFIAKNFGSNVDGNDNPWFILYNRYNGTLRVFIQVNSSYNSFQSASIKLNFTNGFNTNGLLSQIGINTLPLNMLNGKTSKTLPNQFVNSGQGSNLFFWLYGDIPTLYDPCSCKNYSRLNLQALLFSNWEVNLTINGTITTKVVAITNTSSSVVSNQNYGFGLDKFFNSADNIINGVTKFTDAGNKLVAAGNQISSGLNGVLTGKTPAFTSTFFDQLFGATNSVFAGVKAIFSAVSLITSIFEKPNGRPLDKTITTTTFSESKLKATATGTISQSSLFGNGYLTTPGGLSTSPNNISQIKPSYNNILGVFNIIEKPTLEAAQYPTVSSRTNGEIANSTDCIYNGNCPYVPDFGLTVWQYKISGSLKYVLNPASGLKINKMQVALVFPITKQNIPTYPDQPTPTASWPYPSCSPAWLSINEDKLNQMGYNLILKKTDASFDGAVISTQFVPVTCMDKLSFFLAGGDISAVDSIGLRVFLEMEPITPNAGTNVNKIIQVYTYYYSPSEVTRYLEYAYYDDIVSLNSTGAYVTAVGAWGLGNTGDPNNPDYRKWNNTFAGLATNLKLTNTTVTKDIVCFRDLEIGPNVVFSSPSNIKLYVLGNIINNSGSTFPPSNVTVINNVKDPCGQLISTVTDPTTFCNSTRYSALSAILQRGTEDSIADNQHHSSANYIKRISLSPNPANNQTTLSFKLLKESDLKIQIFNSAGSLVSEVVNQRNYNTGEHHLNLSTETLVNGIYIVRIISNQFSDSKKLIIKK